MPTTILSSREFDQNVSRAIRAAKDGPVISADRGQPACGLLRLDAIEIDPPRWRNGIFYPGDLRVRELSGLADPARSWR